MLKATTVAAAILALSGAAQADTVKQIWNQELGENNPGRVESTGQCLQDDSSRFGCWNDSDDVDFGGGGAGGADEPPPTQTEDDTPRQPT